MNPRFLITKVAAEKNFHLLLNFADGASYSVNLYPLIKKLSSLSVLMDEQIFATVTLGTGGFALQWQKGDIELASDNLRAMAVEQSGAYSHELIWNWMARNNLSLTEAAKAIGISRRMLAYYRSGEREIPKTVALALIGWEVEQEKVA